MYSISQICNTIWWLLRADLTILTKNIWGNLIDSLIIPTVFIIIGGYILPFMGMPVDYGAFMTVSSTMMMAYSSTAWRGAGPLIADLESNKSISYELTLPIPSQLVFIKVALGFAINAMLLNILTLPMGKLLLGSKFDLSHFSLFKFILMYPTTILSFAFFSTTIAFWVKSTMDFGRFRLRIESQLFFFSGMQFPWVVLLKAWPTLAYIDLLNPLLYAFEGFRVAVLGQEGNINFWICFAMLWLWIGIFNVLGYYLFKRKLDCV